MLMDPVLAPAVWAPDQLARLRQHVELVGEPATTLDASNADALDEIELLITGWSVQSIDQAFLDRLPRLRLVLHAAGSMRLIGSAALWESGIPVVSAIDENARPTAEFAAAEIVYALKRGWQSARELARTRRWFPPSDHVPGLGGSTVGLVSLGRVGRLVAERLSLIGGIRILAHDPFVDPAEFAGTGIELVTLDELFARSHVVSLHTPLTESTRHLVTESLLRSMLHGATLINTARGGVIDEAALIRVLRERDDLFAALDVTEEEPPPFDSPLHFLDNVMLTPHIAGSAGAERTLLADAVLDQLERFLAGEPIDVVDAHDRTSPRRFPSPTHRSEERP